MKTKIILAFLVITLAACTPTQPNTMDIQNTAVAIVQTGVALTQTALPTATFSPPTFTPTALPTSLPPATATATQPIFPIHIILTPDAIQVERWKEYQAELAKVVLSFDPDHPEGYDPETYKDALCEWDILGQSGQEMYVWAECASTDDLRHPKNPAVIYLKPDGSIREVDIARAGMDRRNQLAVYDLHLFPINVQEKLCLYYFQGIVPQCASIIPDYVPHLGQQPREGILTSHREYREGHAEEPPLVVLSVIQTSTPPATQLSTSTQ
jgi:hypothetical protein